MDSKDRMNGRLIFEGCAGRAAERVLAGDEAALVAEDEALRTGVAAPSVAAVLLAVAGAFNVKPRPSIGACRRLRHNTLSLT